MAISVIKIHWAIAMESTVKQSYNLMSKDKINSGDF